MIEAKAFPRRIKIHIVGPEHDFAVIVPPELAAVCAKEVDGLGIGSHRVSEAGIEFSGKLKAAYLCHLWSRSAGRVFCRLPEFRAGAPEELFQKISQIPWELWIDPEIPVEIDAHVEYSRISHEGRTAELVMQGMERCMKKNAPRFMGISDLPAGGEIPGPEGDRDTDLKQRVLIRLIRNHCTVSLDMTGPHLHERGYRLRHTGAPLRETIAAAILLRSEWDGGCPLVDGMCGSGTFPIEAAWIARKIAPGLRREFLFQKWPSFQKQTWEHLCRTAREGEIDRSPHPIVGIDLDPEAIGAARENALRAGVESDIDWKLMDFFDFNPRESGLKKGLVVLNPPYGKRLSGGGGDFYEKLGGRLRMNYKGWRFAVLAGSRLEAAALGMGKIRFWMVRHGGMPVAVALGRVPS